MKNEENAPEPDPEVWARFEALIAVQEEISPTDSSRGTQDLVEPILLQEARRRGGEALFSTELLSFEQDEAGVTATVRNRTNGSESKIRAAYMIGTDGANSFVLRHLGIPYSGGGALGYVLNILFHADLREFVRGREFSQCLIERPEMIGVFLAINNSDRWTLHLPYDPRKGEKPEDFPPERCKSLISLALGMPDVEIEIKGILPWVASVRVAETFQRGRVFLAGDAAHEVTPWGGLGANTGIADVHNLAWKLALVLKGLAKPALLETYTIERHAIGHRVAEFSRSQTDGTGLPTRERFEPAAFLTSAMSLLSGPAALLIGGHGYKYTSRAIVPEERNDAENVELNGQPGTRVPHLWVSYQGQRSSTVDLAAGSFVLLAGPDGQAWCDAARAAAAHFKIQLRAYRVAPDGDLRDPEGQWPHKAGIEADGALLVRPDGFVAWRALSLPDALPQKLEQVLASLLG